MTALAVPSAAPSPWRAELAAMLTLAWPIIVTQLAQVSMVTIDVVLLGWLGPDALAAGALGANVWFVLLMFGIGVTTATAPMMAQALGAKRHAVREVRRTLRQGAWAALAWSVPAIAVMWHAEPLLLALGQDAAVAAAAQTYTRALAPSVPAALLFHALRMFTAALERPRPALVVQLVELVFNAILAYALIFGALGLPALGLVGAGVATSAACWLGTLALLAVVLVDRRLRRFHPLGRFWRPDWPRFATLWRLGLPIALTVEFEVGVFSAAVVLMGLLGTAELAAHQIAIQIAATSFMVPYGLAQAATVRVGLAAGAGDAAGVARAGWMAMALSLAFMGTMAVAMIAARRQLAGLFLDLDRPENLAVGALAAQFLVIAGLFQLFDGAQTVAIGALRGLKDTRVPMVFAALGYWVIAFPLATALGFAAGLGGVGIWIGLAVGLAVVAALATLRFARRERLGLVPA